MVDMRRECSLGCDRTKILRFVKLLGTAAFQPIGFVEAGPKTRCNLDRMRSTLAGRSA